MPATSKLILGTVGCVLAVVVLLVTLERGAITARQVVDEVRNHSVPTISALQDMRFGIVRIIASTAELLLIRSNEKEEGAYGSTERELIDQGQAIFAAAMQRYLGFHTGTGPGRSESVDVFTTRIFVAYDEMMEVSRELIALSERGAQIDEIVELKEEFEDKETAALKILNTHLAEEQEISEAALEWNVLRLNIMSREVIFLGVITVIIFLVFGFYNFSLVRRLSETKSSLQAILNYSPTKIHIKDIDGRYVLVNRHAEKLFGVTDEEARGKTTDEIFPAEISAAFAGHDRAVLESGEVVEQEEEWPGEDGISTYLTVKFPILDANGRINGVGAIGTDITERKRFEESLRESAKFNAIGQLAGGVAHDFNNLLMVIDGYTRRAMAKRNDQKVIEESLAAVLSAAQKAGSLTKQLLSFSRRQVMQKRVFRVSDVLRDVEVLLRRLIGEQYGLKFLLSDEGLCVETDPDEFSQAIINLAINARDAMPEGGCIFIGTRNSDVDQKFLASHPKFEADRIFEVYVRDEGHGMNADTLLHVFEPFFTTKEQGKGTGLGLAMVYGFAQQSGSEIDISSTLGEGTTVHIYLPVVDRIPDPALSNLAVTLRGKGETVLLVEDDDALRLLIQETLEEIGYSVLIASDGAEAIETDEEYEGKIDLLLTDMVMPGINGLEVADCVKQARPHVKILVMSGYPTRGDSKNPEIPADLPFLQKPASSDQLAQKVREVLDRESSDNRDADQMELASDG